MSISSSHILPITDEQSHMAIVYKTEGTYIQKTMFNFTEALWFLLNPVLNHIIKELI